MRLDSTDNIYTSFARVAGASPAQQLGWETDGAQQRAFDALLELVREFAGPLHGKVVHDAGCGYGHLQPRIAATGARYIGTDCLESTLVRAAQMHPGAEFRYLDLTLGPVPEADITIICGALAFHAPEVVRTMLERLWGASRHAIVFNAWWNVPHAWDNYRATKQCQRMIDDFLRKNGSIRRKMFDYGNKHEAAFALVR